MQVKEIMTSKVEVVAPENTLEEAARKMKDLDIGSLPVCENDHLVGVLTDRDVTVRSTAQGEDPTMDRVGDVMTPEVICCFEDDDVAKASQLMRRKQVCRLPVLDRDRRLVGILSLDDLAINTDAVVGGNTLEGVTRAAAPGPDVTLAPRQPPGRQRKDNPPARVLVKTVMSQAVETVAPHCTLQEAAARMKAANVGALPVCEGDQPVGMITDRDITLRAVALGHDAFEDRVRDVMTPNVVACHGDQDVREAAELMKKQQVHRLVVLDRDERLVGIVALDDLAGHGVEGESFAG